MNRKDIKNLNSIVASILNEATESGDADVQLTPFSPQEIEQLDLIDSEPYRFTAGGRTIVTFFLKEEGEDQAFLHRLDGPAIIIEEGGEGKEFFFIDGKEVSENDLKTTSARDAILIAKQGKLNKAAAAGGDEDWVSGLEDMD